MLKIAQYKALEAQLAEQLAQLDAFKKDGEVKREIEFEEKLKALLAEYGFSLREVVAILDPQASKKEVATAKRASGPRRERELKVYINPHTNERVETKGGNQRVLQSWRKEYGEDVVRLWIQ